jgi:transposase-like protein
VRRPVCEGCGKKFTDDRWEAIGYTRDWSNR